MLNTILVFEFLRKVKADTEYTSFFFITQTVK